VSDIPIIQVLSLYLINTQHLGANSLSPSSVLTVLWHSIWILYVNDFWYRKPHILCLVLLCNIQETFKGKQYGAMVMNNVICSSTLQKILPLWMGWDWVPWYCSLDNDDRWIDDCQGNTKVMSENMPQYLFVYHSPMWTVLELNPGLCSEELVLTARVMAQPSPSLNIIL
jgi:hypothetical protein